MAAVRLVAAKNGLEDGLAAVIDGEPTTFITRPHGADLSNEV